MTGHHTDDASRLEQAVAAYLEHYFAVTLGAVPRSPDTGGRERDDDDAQFDAYFRRYFPGVLDE